MELKSDPEVPTTTILGRIAHGKVPCATLESFSVSQLQKMSELDQSDDLATWGCIQKNSRFFPRRLLAAVSTAVRTGTVPTVPDYFSLEMLSQTARIPKSDRKNDQIRALGNF